MENLYKILGEHDTSIYGHHGAWSLPRDEQTGTWMRPVKGPLLDANGYHLYRSGDLVNWLGAALYEAEWRGERRAGENDVIVREARLVRRLERWNDETARDFAAACADHVLPIFESQRPHDDRPREAIEAARLFALGEATAEELAAAGARARNAITANLHAVAGDALAAARAAAMSAAVGPGLGSGSAAQDAARAAREAAAWAAARAAAQEKWGAIDPLERRTLSESMAASWASADAVEWAWQTRRLLTYLDTVETAHEIGNRLEQAALAS